MAAHDADGKTAAHRLAVGHDIGLDAEIFLGAARRQAEADEDLVEDQHDAALAADRAELLQPGRVGSPIDAGVRPAVDQGGVGRRPDVGMKRLHRIDQHAGDVAAAPQHRKSGVGHFRQRVGVVGGHRVAHAGLNVAPPAVVGAAETHEMGASCVIAGQTDRLHHRFRPRHVERDLGLAGNPRQARHVVGDQRRVGPQHRAERAHAPGAALHAAFVEIVSQQVHAVRPGEIVEDVAVEIGELDAVRSGEKRASGQMRLHVRAEREGHAVALGELQVGDAERRFGCPVQCPRSRRPQQARQSLEGGAAAGRDVCAGAVGVEEIGVVKGVMGHQRRDATGEARMAGEGPMLGAGQNEPCAQLHRRHGDQQAGQHERGDRPAIQCHCHPVSLASSVAT